MPGAAVVPSLLLLLTAFGVAASSVAAATGMARSSCTRRCGSISITYPFGVEPGCYHADGFNLTCNQLENPPKLFLGDGTMQVLEIFVADGRVCINRSRVDLTFEGINTTVNGTLGGLPQNWPYFVSESVLNRLVVVGCGIQVDLRGGARDVLLGSCTAVCPTIPMGESGGVIHGNQIIGLPGNCSGIGCCDTNIGVGYSVYHLHGSLYAPEALPAMLDWVINNSTCPTNASAPECRSANSSCRNSTFDVRKVVRTVGYVLRPFVGYVCYCSNGYQGNPYIPGGCQDIDECRYSPEIYLCYGNCKNTAGNYVCKCPSGYTGNASAPNGCKDIDECEHQEANSCYGMCQNFPGSFDCRCPDGTYGNSSVKGGCITIKENSFTGLSIGLGVGGGIGLLLLALGGPYIIRKIKQQKVKKMKQQFFKQNHGLLLQQLITRNTDIGDRMIITLRDIRKRQTILIVAASLVVEGMVSCSKGF